MKRTRDSHTVIRASGYFVVAENGLVLPHEPEKKKYGRYSVLLNTRGEWFLARKNKPIRFQTVKLQNKI